MKRVAVLLALVIVVGAAAAAARITDPGTRSPADVERAGPRILATGDSLMRGVDRELEKQLRRGQRASLRSDLHIGDGITNAPWVRTARRQVRDYRPTVTVAFMGGNDGYDMRGARCCHKMWVAKYTSRVETMIHTYLRGGSAEVYWLTLPAAESGRRREIFPKVNRAIRRAVRASGSHAHVVDAWAALTPDDRYRRTIPLRGKRVKIRHPDGIHLVSAGAAIVADLIVKALVRDGVIASAVR